MSAELSILLVEDEPDDAQLVVHTCRQAGMNFRWRRVDTRETFLAALASERPDLIISDYSMPRFNGMMALQLAREKVPEVPFIVATGSLNEEIAVECMRAGAADYVLKERLARLPLAVRAALEAFADRHARRAAEEQTRIQAVALESAANGIVITDPEGRVTWANPAFAELTGLSLEASRGQLPPFLCSEFHPPGFYRQLWESVRAGDVWRREVYSRRADGSTLIADVTVTPLRGASGELERLVVIQQDLTARKHQDDEIQRISLRDPLTRLPNRASLHARLASQVADAGGDQPGALLILDIDHFKDFNRSFGSGVGDRIIMWVAERLADSVPDGASLARIGGDEFGVLLPAAPVDTIAATAEQIRSTVGGGQLEEGDHLLDISISIGVALIDGQLDAGAVWTLADTTLAMGKELGSDRVSMSQDGAQDVRKRATEIGRWAARVSEGLRRDLFLLHYQPIVDLATSRAKHFEVLVRMSDGQGGLVPPMHFLPAAERFGLVAQLDRWVVDHAIAELTADPRLRLFVNLAGSSLADDSLREHVEGRVAELGDSASRLLFEITETSAVGDLERVRRWILRIKSLGGGFALDDFGTGFSSFSYLRSLPVDYVKIDGSFIKDLDTNATNRALVQAMTAVAHTLGQQVVAEAVEHRAIADELLALGVDLGQGYLWQRPAPLHEAVKILDLK